MASFSSNFLDGLRFYFITKKLGKLQHKILTEKIKRFGGTVSSHFDRSTTHVLFPREVDYQSGMDSLKSTTVGDTIVLVSIDWLSDCIGERKLIPTAQFQVRRVQLARVARERVPRVLRNAESRERRESMDGERMRTNGNSKGVLGISKWRRSLRFLHQSLVRLESNIFRPPFTVIMKFNAGISVINLNITNFMLFWQIKPCQVEKYDSASHSINSGPAGTFSRVHAKITHRRIRFPVSGTSKFLGASLVVGKVGKDVFLRRTLAYGTTYGIGVFCLTEEGEQQIGWVPGNNQTVLDVVRRIYSLPGFRAKIDTAASKTMADKFTKITIYLICELQ